MRTGFLLLKSFIYDICYILLDRVSLDTLPFYFTVPSSLSHMFKHEFSSKIILSLLFQVFLPLKIFSYFGNTYL